MPTKTPDYLSPKSTRSKKASDKIYLNKYGSEIHADPTQKTVEEVMAAAKLIAKEGYSRQSIIDYFMAKGYSFGSAVMRYDAAQRYLMPTVEEQEKFRDKQLATLISRYETLYEKAVANENVKVAREILDSMAKMYGLLGGNKVNITENAEGDKTIEISFE